MDKLFPRSQKLFMLLGIDVRTKPRSFLERTRVHTITGAIRGVIHVYLRNIPHNMFLKISSTIIVLSFRWEKSLGIFAQAYYSHSNLWYEKSQSLESTVKEGVI